MGLIDDIKAKADQNGDGKISTADLESLKNGNNNDQLDKLKDLADQNDDGKLNFDDVKGFDFGKTISQAKDSLGGLFGKK